MNPKCQSKDLTLGFLWEPELPPQRRIGFTAQDKSGRYSIGRKR